LKVIHTTEKERRLIKYLKPLWMLAVTPLLTGCCVVSSVLLVSLLYIDKAFQGERDVSDDPYFRDYIAKAAYLMFEHKEDGTIKCRSSYFEEVNN
jgi:hypothetical protein